MLKHHPLSGLVPGARILFAAALLFAATVQAAPLLRCQINYSGETRTLVAAPVSDPYSVPNSRSPKSPRPGTMNFWALSR